MKDFETEKIEKRKIISLAMGIISVASEGSLWIGDLFALAGLANSRSLGVDSGGIDIFSLIHIIPLIIAIIGLVCSIKPMKKEQNGIALAGFIISILGIIIHTVAFIAYFIV